MRKGPHILKQGDIGHKNRFCFSGLEQSARKGIRENEMRKV
jgi:hypothetical protein